MRIYGSSVHLDYTAAYSRRGKANAGIMTNIYAL
jgi:hypothetical protein